MGVGGNRKSRKIRALLRREANAGEAQRQTVYTLLLAFVPFAAIVGALAVNSNAQIVESLARRLRDVDSALDVIRTLAGADEETSPETLVAQARWAFKNKESIEIHFVESVDMNSLSYAHAGKDGNDIPVAEESKNVVVLAGLSHQDRCIAIVEAILLHVVHRLPGLTVEGLSTPTRNVAKDMAEAFVAQRERSLYRTYLDRGLANERLSQSEVCILDNVRDPVGPEHIRTSPEGDGKIEGWITAIRPGFRDPPEKEAETIEKTVAEQFREAQLKVVWSEFEQLKPTIDQAIAECSLSPTDFLETNVAATGDRVFDEIQEKTVDPAHRGPLPKWACQRRAEEVLAQRKAQMERVLLAALPQTLDDTTRTKLIAFVRKDHEKLRGGIEAYSLDHCRRAVRCTTVLAKADLEAFPNVGRALTDRTARIEQEITAVLNDEIQNNIKGLAGSVGALDAILARAPKDTLSQAANLAVKNTQLTPETLPALDSLIKVGVDAIAKGYPLSQKETQQIQQIVVAHVKRRAEESQKSIVEGVATAVGKATVLDQKIDLTAFRNREELVNEVAQAILTSTPGAGNFDAARQKAREGARRMVENRREVLVKRMYDFIQARLQQKLQGMKTETVPPGTTERARLADAMLAEQFPVRSADVIGAADDLDEGYKQRLVAEVQRSLSNTAVQVAIQTAAVPAGFDPFQKDAKEKLEGALARQIAAGTGEGVEGARSGALAAKVSQLLDSHTAKVLTQQLEAIKKLADANLSEGIVGMPGDEKRAFELLQAQLLNQLKHTQLGPQAKLQLESVARTLVEGRHKRTLQAQLDTIEAFKPDRLPSAIDRLIAKAEQASAVSEMEQFLAKAVAAQTRTSEALDETNSAIRKKATALVEQRRKQIGDAQRQAIQTLTVAELRGSVIPLIVADKGDEFRAVSAMQKDLDAVVRKQTGTSDAPSVLPEVVADLTAKVKTLVHEQRQRTATAQLAVVRALTVAELPDSVIPSIVSAKGDTSQAAREIQKDLDALVRERTNTMDATSILDEVRSVLEERSRQLVSAKHEEELRRQCALVEPRIASYKIRAKGGQTFEQFLDTCVQDICALAGIPVNRRLPGTRQYISSKISTAARERFDERMKLQQNVKTLLMQAGGSGTLETTNVPAPIGPQIVPADGVTDDMTDEELKGAADWLRKQMERKQTTERAVRVLREEMTWKPEWARRLSEDLPYGLVDDVEKALTAKGLPSVAEYRGEIENELGREFRNMHRWCNTEAKKLLDSTQAKSMLDAEVAPYIKGQKDFSEWYPDPERSILIDDKKLSAVTASIVDRLIGRSARSAPGRN